MNKLYRPTFAENLRIHCVSVRLNNSELNILEQERKQHAKGEWLRMCLLKTQPSVVPESNRAAWKMFGEINHRLNEIFTGCDGEPSPSEIQTAMQENIDHTNQQARQRFGENSIDMLTTLNKAEKVCCKESEAKGTYLCKVNTDITPLLMGEKQIIAEFKFINNDGN